MERVRSHHKDRGEIYRPVISRYLFAEERADAEESWVSGDRCQSSMSDESQPRR
jgi:hypothetical protein